MTIPAYVLRLMTQPRGHGFKLRPEERLAVHFANCCRAWTLAGHLDGVWFHIPNEIGGGHGDLSARVYMKHKHMGLIAGSPDYGFAWNTGSGFLEAKAGRNTQSDTQEDFEGWARINGCYYEVFRSVAEAAGHLKAWGILDGRATVPMEVA